MRSYNCHSCRYKTHFIDERENVEHLRLTEKNKMNELY